MLGRLPRSTGLRVLGRLPSNDLIRLQLESSTGFLVPILVPDGARSGLPVATGSTGRPRIARKVNARQPKF